MEKLFVSSHKTFSIFPQEFPVAFLEGRFMIYE